MMKKIFLMSGLILCLFKVSASAVSDVSIISLISEPSKYNGKMITVTGVVGLAPEEGVLYLNKWSFKYFVKANSICLDVGSNKEYDHFHSSAAIVYGKLVKHEYCGYVLVVKNMAITVPRQKIE